MYDYDTPDHNKSIVIKKVENGFIISVNRPTDPINGFSEMATPFFEKVIQMKNKELGEEWKNPEPTVDEEIDAIIKKGPPPRQTFLAKTWEELQTILATLKDFHGETEAV